MRSLMMFGVLASALALADGHAEKLAAAADLPTKAKELRDSGLDADQVVAAIDAAKEAKLSAGEAAEMLGGAAPLVKEHGPVENFGDFVKGKLEEGLRGEELAAAIKAEHEGGGKAGGTAASPKPEAKPTPKPAGKPGPKPGGLTRPGVKPGGKLTRPGGRGGKTKRGGGGGGSRGGGGGGGLTRPGGAR